MNADVHTRMHELEALTRSYARYSRNAGGLSSVLGGVLCLMAYFGGPLLHGFAPATAVLIAIPGVWLLAKGWMTRRYYQRLGHVEQIETQAERLLHWFCVGFVLLVALAITASVAFSDRLNLWSLPAGMIGYLVLLWLLVVAAWRWLRSPLDFIVGVFLFCQAAVVSAGSYYPLIGMTDTPQEWQMSLIALMFPLAGLAMIVNGVREHRQFQQLRQRLQQLRSEGDA